MPDGRRLASADRVVGGRHRRVEAARGAQRDREDRAVAVDRVVGEQDRDVQPGLLDRDVLEVVDLRRVGQAEDAADAGLGVRVGDLAVGEQLQLLQLLRRASSVSSRVLTFRSMPRCSALPSSAGGPVRRSSARRRQRRPQPEARAQQRLPRSRQLRRRGLMVRTSLVSAAQRRAPPSRLAPMHQDKRRA